MAEQPCLGQVHACVMRLADLDVDGVPLPGAENLYVTGSLVTMSPSPVYTEGDEIEEKNGCGEAQVQFKGNPTFKRVDFTIQILTPDPYASAMLSQGSVMSGFDGARVGWKAPALGVQTSNGISIELWTKRIDNGDLDVDSPYGWWVYPKAKNLKLDPWEHGASALKPSFSGELYENPNWFDGPLNDWLADSDRVAQWVPTDTIPTPMCSFQALLAS